jgi:hypothetical protein
VKLVQIAAPSKDAHCIEIARALDRPDSQEPTTMAIFLLL